MNIIDDYIKKQIEISISLRKTKINLFKKHILWYFIHSLTFIYPENPTFEDKKIFAEFFVLHLQNLLPNCRNCKINYNNHIQEANLDIVFANKKNLTNFFIDMHNKISETKSNNSGINYKQYTYSEVEEIYQKYNFIEYFKEKYNINIVELIYNNSQQKLIELILEIQNM